tara:strand:+ start:401 stop:568 length:168 start_codon:yes stop_codon:yes gene_type:complete
MAHPKKKSQKQEEIREEPITKLQKLRLQLALQRVRPTYTTEHIGLKVNYIIEGMC